ncbi:MAG: hypothetical protein WCG06_06760 [Candidatus Omnitrophota bacterium]
MRVLWVAGFVFSLAVSSSPVWGQETMASMTEVQKRQPEGVFSAVGENNKRSLMAFKTFLSKISRSLQVAADPAQEPVTETQLKLASSIFGSEIRDGRVSGRLTDSRRTTEFYDDGGHVVGTVERSGSSSGQGSVAPEKWYRVDPLKENKQTVLFAQSTTSVENDAASRALSAPVSKGWKLYAAETHGAFYHQTRFYDARQKLVGQLSERADGRQKTWLKYSVGGDWEIL